MKIHQHLARLLLVAPFLLPQTANADVLTFAITRYEVEGNTLLAEQTVEDAVNPYTGQTRDFGDIQRALEALEQAYRKAGYSAVQVSLPEQKLDAGVVHLKVTEAKIGKVIIEGNRHFDTDNIRASLPGLKEGETPNADEIAANLRVANESPAKQTQVVLRVGDKEGDVDAAVTVADEKPQKVFLTLDNTGTKATGTDRFGIGYQHANVFNRDQVFTAQYTTSLQKLSDVSIYGLGYHLPIYALGDSVDLFGGYSDVNSGTVGGLFTVSGKGVVLGARYNLTLPRIDTYQHKLSWGLDYRAYKNSVVLLSGGTSVIPDYTVHPLSLTYAGQWLQPTQSGDFYVTLLRDFPGGSKGGDSDLALARTGADARYTVLKIGGSYARPVLGDWQTRLALSGQYTPDALVPGEQFGIGGATSVRGFQEREVANDYGYRGSLELYGPDLGAWTKLAKASLRGLAFLDFGRVFRNKLQPGESDSQSIASLGVGMRFALGKDLTAGLDFAQVIDAGGSQAKGDQMLHMNLGATF